MQIFPISTVQDIWAAVQPVIAANAAPIIMVLSFVAGILFVMVMFSNSTASWDKAFRDSEERKYGKGGFRD